jgi:hypothetical protein
MPPIFHRKAREVPLKKVRELCLLALGLITLNAWGQGVSLNTSVVSDVRFVPRDDHVMGSIVLDTSSGLEYMRCLVGQKYLRQEPDVANQCKDDPQLLSFANAQRLVRQVGSGWRLPTIAEMQQIMNSKTYADTVFWTEPPYRGAFIYKEVQGGFWTSNTYDKGQYTNIAVGNGFSASESLMLKDYEGFAYPVANGTLARVRLVRRR